jgi:hypothetical protein
MDDFEKLLRDYLAAGWVVVAMPPEIAELIVGEQATTLNAVAFMAELEALKKRLDLAGL